MLCIAYRQKNFELGMGFAHTLQDNITYTLNYLPAK